MYPRSGFGGKIFVLGSIRFNRESIDSRFLHKTPQRIYDPKIPLNIIGVPALGTFFGDNTDVHSPLTEDGTTVKSSAKSHFVWDHGNHERHFIHVSTQLPEITLYVGHGYSNDFFT